MVSSTRSHLPLRQVARAVTRPEAVSMRTMVSGSTMGSMPVSSRTVVRQMELEPDMAWALSPCRMMKAISASGRVGGKMRQVLICAEARGSNTRKRRKLSSTSLRCRSLSAMVLPGTSMTPPVTIRPTSPSAWASTRVTDFDQRMGWAPQRVSG